MKHIKRIIKRKGNTVTGNVNILSQLEECYRKLYCTNRKSGEQKHFRQLKSN